MKAIIFLLLSIFILQGCSNDRTIAINDKSQFCKVWKLRDIDANIIDSLSDYEKSLFDYITKSLALHFHFYPNNVFSIIEKNGYNHGSWKYDDEGSLTIQLKANHNPPHDSSRFDQIIVYEPRNITLRNGKKFLTLGMSSGGELILEEHEPMLENIKHDPFYPDNNLWRYKPHQRESILQLKERLLNYITHIKYLFKAAIERKGKRFSNKHSKGIIAIYAGGIGILRKEKVSSDWINTYYEQDQAWAAYHFFKEYLGSKVLTRNETGSWEETNYAILKDIDSLQPY